MRSRRLAGLDGIRGIAILLVLVAHLFGLNGSGLVGVLMFFVLSGYLITSLLLKEAAWRGAVDLPHFYLRRALRLLPPLLLLLAIVGVLSLVPGTGISPADAVRGAVHGLFYVTDFVLGLQLNFVPELAHLWTLAVEEQFYLVWPLVLLVLARRCPKEVWLRVMAWMLGVGVLLRVLTLSVSDRLDLFFYALPTTWVETLLVGCTLGMALHLTPHGLPRLRAAALHPATGIASWLVIAVFALNPATFTAPLTYLFGIPLLALATARLVLSVVVEGPGPTLHVLELPVLRWLGDRSYGLYLFNSMSVLVLTTLLGPGFATRALGVSVALGLAVVSRRYVEQPALDLKARVGAPRPPVVP